MNGAFMGYVFGPVPSRRLGRSLGIDLVPFKTCTYDCIYCQLGRTNRKITERHAWVTWPVILEELTRKLDSRPDYITLSGSGEPTLHAGLGELIQRIKTITSVPVAVLTNGSLLWRTDVRADLQEADLVIPSLDAGDELSFQKVNRPHSDIAFARLMEGLIAFRQQFRGQYWLEVFLLAGVTSLEAEVEKIAAGVKLIQPDRVQLNTVTRPPAETSAEAVSRSQLVRLASLFQPPAELIADYDHPAIIHSETFSPDEILELVRRRPCSIRDIAAALGIHVNETLKCLDELTRQGLVEPVGEKEETYYRIKRGADKAEA